jgi:ATP-dependent exoDNAse (exonuclease V) alpha subunit
MWKRKTMRVLLEKGAKSRLIMHLTGSGGSGKRFVLKATKLFCQHFCKAIGQPFDESAFIISATTNTAAAQVKGDTIHSLAGLWSRLSNIIRTGKINWRIAKVLFIDEISMLDIKDF